MTTSEQQLPCIVFKLNDHKYALNIRYITEIMQVGDYNVLPEMPPHMLGLFRFRDQVVPLIDLNARLGLVKKAKIKQENEERIMIVNGDGKWIGLKVDAIDEVVQVEKSQYLDLEDRAVDEYEVVDGVYPLGDDRVTVLKFDTVIDPDSIIDLAGWQQAASS